MSKLKKTWMESVLRELHEFLKIHINKLDIAIIFYLQCYYKNKNLHFFPFLRVTERPSTTRKKIDENKTFFK